MKKLKNSLLGFTLIEMLIVMAIFVILSAMGAGAFAGIRETTIIRQDVENLKQDIQLAKQKSMLLERGPNENWLYGIGIDFSEVDTTGEYRLFKWCSPFTDFGSPATTSELPGYSGGEITITNGYLPVETRTTSCSGQSSLVELAEYVDTSLSGGINIIGIPSIYPRTPAEYVVFEAVTGKAFLYDGTGAPSNYTYSSYSLDVIALDIVIDRKRSTKFEVLSIYPLSGTVIDHVYNRESDLASPTEVKTRRYFIFDGIRFSRYGIADELKSYREE